MSLVRVVHVDLAFALVLLVDGAWLWATGVLAGVSVRPGRLAGVAALGAVLDVLALFPAGKWLALGPARLLAFLLPVVLAYGGRDRWRALPRTLMTYLGLGAAMAGGTLLLAGGTAGVAVPRGGGHLLVLQPVLQGSTPLIWAGSLLAIGGLRIMVTGLGAWWQLRRGLVEVVVDCGWGPRRLVGLVDSGNLLRDPLSGDPVLVVGQAALAGAVPEGLLALTREGGLETLAGVGESEAGLAGVGEAWAGRCRWVPYRTVGRPAGGVLPALRPVGLTVAGRPVRALVALGPPDLGGGGAYQALVPQWLLDGGAAASRESVTVGRGDEA